MSQTVDPPALRRTPLYDRHVALGARTGDFGGWDMPIRYPAGVVAEHTAVRERVGVFDVSHMGKVAVRGPGAAAFLNAVLANDLDRVGAGRAQYTLLCADDGGVVDDLIVYRRGDDDLLFVPNAANAAAVVAAVAAAAPAGVAVVDRHDGLGILAVQGPRSADLLDALGLPRPGDYMAFVDAALADAGLPGGGSLVVCRTGYTGEHGYELLVPADALAAVWDRLLEAGAPLGVSPCGLGARDTLRTEMGYPLHGQDISREVTPVQARLGWAVGWGKPAFAGRDALLAERAAGPARTLRGLRSPGRTIPRPGMAVRSAGGEPLGEVTSGTFSPTLQRGIGLALLRAGVADGDEVVLDVRGRPAPVEVVRPPFVTPSTR